MRFKDKTAIALVMAVLATSWFVVATEPPTLLWTLRATSSLNPNIGSTFVRGIAADTEGNSYFFGPLRGKATLNGEPVIEETEGLPNVLAKLSPTGRVIWLKRLGFGPIQSFLVAPNKNEVVLTGTFPETANLGGTNVKVGSVGSMIVAKFGSDGQLLWYTKPETSRDCYVGVTAVSLDSNGAILVAGVTSGKVSIGPSTIEGSKSATCAFLARFTPDGKASWVTPILGDGIKTIDGVSCDSDGNAYITGDFKQSIKIGTNCFTALGKEDVFVTKVDKFGTFAWARAFGGNLWDLPTSIGVDSEANSYVVGYFAGTAKFGETTVTATGEKEDQDIFLCKLNQYGGIVWVRTYGSSSGDKPGVLLFNQHEGDIYLSGLYTSIPALGLTNKYWTTQFLVGLDSAGNGKWSKMYDYGIVSPPQIATDGVGNIFTVGSFDGVQSNRTSPISFITKLGFTNQAPGRHNSQ